MRDPFFWLGLKRKKNKDAKQPNFNNFKQEKNQINAHSQYKINLGIMEIFVVLKMIWIFLF